MPWPGRTGASAGVAAVATALLALGLLGASSRTSWTVHPPNLDFGWTWPDLPLPSQAAYTPEQGPPATDLPPLSRTVVVWIAAVLIVAALALVAWLIVRWARRRALPVPVGPADQLGLGGEGLSQEEIRRAVADGVDAALARLRAAGPPRDAVVAAWLELEAAAERSGLARQPAQTPTEFTAGLLAASPAPPGAIATLRRLYHTARFSDHLATSQDVEDAGAALGRIAATLLAGAHATVPPPPAGGAT